MKSTAVFVILLAACGSTGAGSGAVAPATAGDASRAEQLSAEARTLFERRGERDALVGALDAWRQALELDPSRADDCAMYGRATQLLGETHDRAAPLDDRVARFEAGMAAVEGCLRAVSPRFARLRKGGVAIEKAVEALEPSAAPLVYRYANNLGSLANARGRVAAIKFKDRIFGLMQWVLGVAPQYDYGGPNRFFGAYYAALPTFLGGDLDKSRKHFDAALAAAPGYPDNHLLLAEFWAVAAKDRALFDRVMQQFAALSPCRQGGSEPCLRDDWAVEAGFSVKRAEGLRARADTLF